LNNDALSPTSIYGLCGFAGSGKNTAASLLLKHTDGHAYSFAAALKDGAAAIFGWPREMLEGDTGASRAWRDQNDVYWSRVFDRSVTPRMILQEVGTEVFRKYLPNIWVAAAARQVQSKHATAIFTDTRFGNEMSWINSQNGVLIWVYRSKMPHLSAATATMVRGLVDRHDNLLDERITRQIQQTCQTDTAHLSETSFLYDGPVRPHIVVKNTSTVDELSSMMQHIYTLHTTTTMADFPWGTRTLYLSVLRSQYWWEWLNKWGLDSYRVYGKDNVCILRGDNDGR
jgi:hypothetical protein